MNNEEFDIDPMLYDTIIPQNLTLDQKKEIFWQTNNPPLWMSINDYIVIYLITKKIKSAKSNWISIMSIEENRNLLQIACATIDSLRYKYFNAFSNHFAKLEFTYYSAHITDHGIIEIFPNNPELLMSTSRNFYKNKKIKCDPQELEKFLQNQIETVDFAISLIEYGKLIKVNSKYLLTHAYGDVPDIIIEFPKWF